MKPRNATINPQALITRAEAKSRRRVEREQRRRDLAAAARRHHPRASGRGERR